MTDQALALREVGLADLDRGKVERARDDACAPIRFGRFQALPAARVLLCEGREVELGSRAFDMLVVLLRARGELVRKDEIVRSVWPDTIVEESNLRFQMAALRRALGDDRDLIKTIQGRGYILVTAPEDSAPRRFPVSLAYRDGVPAEQCDKPAIYIVEEDEDLREALHRLLRPFNARVESFVSLAALLERNACLPETGVTDGPTQRAAGSRA